MRGVEIPSVAKVKTWSLSVAAQSRGGTGIGGHYSFERGPGARVAGQTELTALCTEDALRVRAWLHSLRGRSGSFYMRVPNRAVAENVCDLEDSHFSDCTTFSDAATFSDLWLGEVSGVVESSAAAGDGTIVVTMLAGGAGALAGTEENALAVDFTDDAWFSATGHYGSAGTRESSVSVSALAMLGDDTTGLVVDFTAPDFAIDTGHYGVAATVTDLESVGDIGRAASLQVGDWANIDGQLVRVTAVNTLGFTFRPRLRAAVAAGAPWYGGAVRAEFRILDDAPIVPLIPGRSRELTLEIEEAY